MEVDVTERYFSTKIAGDPAGQHMVMRSIVEVNHLGKKLKLGQVIVDSAPRLSGTEGIGLFVENCTASFRNLRVAQCTG